MVWGVSASLRTAQERMLMTCCWLPVGAISLHCGGGGGTDGRSQKRREAFEGLRVGWFVHGTFGVSTFCVSSAKGLWPTTPDSIYAVEDGVLSDIRWLRPVTREAGGDSVSHSVVRG